MNVLELIVKSIALILLIIVGTAAFIVLFPFLMVLLLFLCIGSSDE